jgi:predicted enzyme related to lactoylglutathione lyase
MPPAAAVIFVDDVKKMTHFYQALGDMQLIQDEPTYAVLETAGLQITIHPLRGSKIRKGEPYPTREDTWIKLCFPIVSIAAARSTAAALGGEVWPPNKEWEAKDRGFRACDGRDPEGNVFQVREVLS